MYRETIYFGIPAPRIRLHARTTMRCPECRAKKGDPCVRKGKTPVQAVCDARWDAALSDIKSGTVPDGVTPLQTPWSVKDNSPFPAL
jgi:hypothetical protein